MWMYAYCSVGSVIDQSVRRIWKTEIDTCIPNVFRYVCKYSSKYLIYHYKLKQNIY